MGELKQIKQNIVCALLFLVFSIFLIVIAIPQQIGTIRGLVNATETTTSRLFPYFSAVVMGVAACGEIILEMLRYFKLKDKKELSEKEVANSLQEIRPLVVFVLCLVYALLFQRVGYLLSTFIVSPIVLWVMGTRKWQHYASVYIIGAIMYFVFQFVLKVPLP